jgi:hypothetical protein
MGKWKRLLVNSSVGKLLFMKDPWFQMVTSIEKHSIRGRKHRNKELLEIEFQTFGSLQEPVRILLTQKEVYDLFQWTSKCYPELPSQLPLSGSKRDPEGSS